MVEDIIESLVMVNPSKSAYTKCDDEYYVGEEVGFVMNYLY